MEHIAHFVGGICLFVVVAQLIVLMMDRGLEKGQIVMTVACSGLSALLLLI